MELLQVNRAALLSFRLGLCSLLAGPLAGLPAVLLGWRGLNQIRRNVGGSGGKRVAQLGIAAGLLGSVMVPTLSYFVFAQGFWPDERIRVSRFFRELEAERFYERQDGMWPTFRELAPDGIYREAERIWPQSPISARMQGGSIFAFGLPSGKVVSPITLRDFAKTHHCDGTIRGASPFALGDAQGGVYSFRRSICSRADYRRKGRNLPL